MHDKLQYQSNTAYCLYSLHYYLVGRNITGNWRHRTEVKFPEFPFPFALKSTITQTQCIKPSHRTLWQYKNIYIVYTTLNKWLRANQLSLNFNKTNYVHFTTMRNMSVNLKIGFNNNFITNNSYTKFLGVTMNNTLSWNNHIDLLMKKGLLYN